MSNGISWVRCDGCGQHYSLGTIKTYERYADCTRWKAPCCGRQCDDRPRGWGGEGFTKVPGLHSKNGPQIVYYNNGKIEYSYE